MGTPAVVAQPQLTDRVELERLAEEQAALRRVATLVACGASSGSIFAAVAEEVAQVMHLPSVLIGRFDDDATSVTILAASRGPAHTFLPGTRWPLDGPTVAAQVLHTGRPARVEDYALPGSISAGARESGIKATAGVPIVVDSRIWGVMAAASLDDPLPDDLEHRLAQFTDLVATAIANSQAREELTRLAEDQAALRRVATLVASGVPPADVFEAVIGEVGRLIGADGAALSRFEPDRTYTTMSAWGPSGAALDVGARLRFEPGTAASRVFETRRPARISSYEGMPGEGPGVARSMGWRSSVAVPVVVEGRLWGTALVFTKSADPFPPDTEARLEEFTVLVATAIANAESRAELATSRARIVATADATRRRIERDLHDGAQQHLLSLALEARAVQAGLPSELGELRNELSSLAEGLTSVLDDLREIAHGIHPALLAEGGLGPALKTLAHRSPIAVELEVHAEARLPEAVEVAAYYVVSEALTNAAKYSGASIVHVTAVEQNRVLRVTVSDNGLGGADPVRGSGLLGLKDRAEAIGGTFCLESPHGAGTTLRVELPLDGDDSGLMPPVARR
jgi:signal transduction histidine kinase